jgi:diguanylate cyclase (GGDEF)-like protein
MTSLSLAQAHREVRPSFTTFWDRGHATGRLAEEVRRAQVDANYEFSILLVAFDGLRHLTGRLGYSSEDGTWRRVLALLTQDLQQGDLCCRLGEDEFLLILPGSGQVECASVAERLFRHWSPVPGTREATLEMSVGIASYPGNKCTVEGLIGTANETMRSKAFRNEAKDAPRGIISH